MCFVLNKLFHRCEYGCMCVIIWSLSEKVQNVLRLINFTEPLSSITVIEKTNKVIYYDNNNKNLDISP